MSQRQIALEIENNLINGFINLVGMLFVSPIFSFLSVI